MVYVASNAPATDANFTFDSTNKSVTVVATASAPAGLFKVSSATTGAVRIPLALYHNTSSTPTAGFSVGMNFLLDSSTTDDITSNRIASEWISATHATYHSKMVLSGVNNGSSTLNTIMELWGNQQIKTLGIHNNPTTNASTGSTADISSGEYTPVVAAVGWAPSSLTASCAQWLRVGNVVTVSGEFNVTPAGAGLGQVQIPVPIATSASSTCQISGTSGAYNQSLNTVNIGGIVTSYNNGASYDGLFQMSFPQAVPYLVKYHFTYLVK